MSHERSRLRPRPTLRGDDRPRRGGLPPGDLGECPTHRRRDRRCWITGSAARDRRGRPGVAARPIFLPSVGDTTSPPHGTTCWNKVTGEWVLWLEPGERLLEPSRSRAAGVCGSDRPRQSGLPCPRGRHAARPAPWLPRNRPAQYRVDAQPSGPLVRGTRAGNAHALDRSGRASGGHGPWKVIGDSHAEGLPASSPEGPRATSKWPGSSGFRASVPVPPHSPGDGGGRK